MTPRRDLLKGAIGTPLAGTARTRSSKLIEIENRKPGSKDWQLTRLRIDRKGGFRSPWMEGYCSSQSVEAGDTIDIMVSANPPGRFKLEIFRMGYYGGLGARLMHTLGPLMARTQPDPPIADRRLRECRWEPSVQVKIPGDWPSGVYLGRLGLLPESASPAPWQSYVVFIVRDRRPADILFQASDNTWQAYNRWPDNYSLYISPRGSLTGDVDVSFDRPYGMYAQIFEAPQSVGSGEFLLWEFPLCYWLEKHGYDVTYCSNSDMVDPACAARARIFLSVGHDEYWDPRQYDSAKAAIASGVSELYLSGNAVCFLSPFRPSSSGAPNRIITRAGRFGGLTSEEKKQMGPFAMEGPNENLLMGARTITPFNLNYARKSLRRRLFVGAA